MKESARTAS